MLTAAAYAEGRAAGLEEAGELLHRMARVHLCKRRTNKLDQELSRILAQIRDEVRALKTQSSAQGSEDSK